MAVDAVPRPTAHIPSDDTVLANGAVPLGTHADVFADADVLNARLPDRPLWRRSAGGGVLASGRMVTRKRCVRLCPDLRGWTLA